ncbi:hypothetical protein NMD65_07995 [Edwardsiella tarda]|uniref:hypothetical protein n=1 Tax=Edwardsiella tarda TaxID=636 RepID=UPI00351C4F6F
MTKPDWAAIAVAFQDGELSCGPSVRSTSYPKVPFAKWPKNMAGYAVKKQYAKRYAGTQKKYAEKTGKKMRTDKK